MYMPIRGNRFFLFSPTHPLHAINKKQKKNERTTEACGALNSAALRNGANAAIIMSRGGGTMLLQALQDHPDVPGVQRYGCSGIRNLVVRNREFAKAFLDEGAEPLLRAAMAKHQTAAAHAKGALRDLGCSVVFNEEWKGVNGDLKR
jgi:hypothetical protein